MTAKQKMTETRVQERMKHSVGLSVQLPQNFGGSFKYDKSQGSSNKEIEQESDMEDRMAFEASGGNTILAADPPSWCASVLPFENWRVIERGALLPLATAIGECADWEFREVAMWFVQAVPALTQFNAVPASRELDVRLKLTTNIDGLTHHASLVTGVKKAQFCNYLGHRPDEPVHPIRTGLTRRETVTSEAGTKGILGNSTTVYKQVCVGRP